MTFSNLLTGVEDRERRGMYLWTMVVRAVILVFVLLALVIPRNPGWNVIRHLSFWILSVLFIAGYVYSLILYLKWRHVARAAVTTSLIDILLLALLVAYTGGLQSPFIIFYLFHLAGTTIFASILQALVVAIGGFILMTLVGVLSKFGPLADFQVFYGQASEPTMHAMQMGLYIVILAIFVTYALLTNIYLQRRLREQKDMIKDHQLRLASATSELTRSFYDLESMTDRIRASGDIERNARSQLMNAERAARTGQLAAGVIHDLADPISSIVSESEMYFIKAEYDPEKEREVMQRILANAQRLTKIVENLRQLTRQVPEVIFSSVDVNALIQRCLTILESERKLRGAVVNTYLDESKPKVLGVDSQLEQVIINLLSNALDAFGKAGGHITIRSRVDLTDLILEFEDDGAGVAPENTKKIFEPFFTTRAAQGALGLGLFTVRAIIEDHKGKIDVRSERGISTVFTLTLPLMR